MSHETPCECGSTDDLVRPGPAWPVICRPYFCREDTRAEAIELSGPRDTPCTVDAE